MLGKGHQSCLEIKCIPQLEAQIVEHFSSLGVPVRNESWGKVICRYSLLDERAVSLARGLVESCKNSDFYSPRNIHFKITL